MGRFLSCWCVLVFFCGCLTPTSTDQKVVARIDNYCITQEEFDEAYANSPHAAFSPIQSKHDFLNNMINQKLILLDAQAHGLDKNKEFLKMVENFWQQSLLTMALKEKSSEGVNLDQWVTSLRAQSTIKINEEYIQ